MQNGRIHFYKGSPKDIGMAIGKLMGARLLKNIILQNTSYSY